MIRSIRPTKLTLLALLLWSSVSTGQTAQRTADVFMLRHPGPWRVALEPVTQQPSFVYGGRFSMGGRPQNEAQFEQVARAVVDSEPEFFGVPSDQLALRSVEQLQLGRYGTSDKVAVVFDQVVSQIAVRHASVSVLFEARSGDVLALDSSAVPGALDAVVAPTADLAAVLGSARAAFQAEYGLEADTLGVPEPIVVGPSYLFGSDSTLTGRGSTLAWQVPVQRAGFVDGAGVKAQGLAIVSATPPVETLRFERTAFGDLEGTVSGQLNLGPEPNTPNNQEEAVLSDLYVRRGNASGPIVATTDLAGQFSVATSVDLPLSFSLEGPWVKVVNLGGANANLTEAAVQGVPVTPLFNPAATEFTTAEVAAFHWINQFHDWFALVDPSDTTMDFQAFAQVNLTVAACNASFGGSDVTFYVSNSNCFNTAFNDIVRHEMGHWANTTYNGFGNQGAFEEGNADAWAYLQTDEPCIDGYAKPGGACLRHAEQLAITKCPVDGDASCHGGASHLEGQALASAIWAVRDRLETQLGSPAGADLADALFLEWMRAFDDKGLLNVIADHWLALDDDNGDLSDLTPHFAAIDGGFRDYGWPGFADPAITLLAGPSDHAGISPPAPAPVTVLLQPQLGAVAGATLRYSVDGAAEQSVAMTPTGNPDEWTGALPSVPAPASISWYVHAETTTGAQATEPANAPPMTHLYHSGAVTELGPFRFDGPDDEGFTSIVVSGAAASEWERGSPAGSPEPTDPDSAFSGTSVFGTDLGLSGGDGVYPASSTTELLSPVFDLSDWSTVRLQYRRFLALPVPSDQAIVRVNGAPVWQAPAPSVLDQLWTLEDIDISAQAAGQPSVQIAWRIQSNASFGYGGWNLDDVRIYRIDGEDPGQFVDVGNSLGGDFTPSLSGSGSLAAGQGFTLTFVDMPPATTGFVFFDLVALMVPLKGGVLVPGVTFQFTFPTPGPGGSFALPASLPVGIPSSTSIWFQGWFPDAGGPVGVSATNGLQLITP